MRVVADDKGVEDELGVEGRGGGIVVRGLVEDRGLLAQVVGGLLTNRGGDLEGDLDVAGHDRGEGFLDEGGVAVLEPVLGELGGYPDVEGRTVEGEQVGI